MCKECEWKYYYGFESEKSWKRFFEGFHFEKLTLVEENKISNKIHSSYNLYMCPYCENLWAYSEPENAWRGFFLPENVAIEYFGKIKKREQNTAFLVLIIILIIIITVIINYFKQ